MSNDQKTLQRNIIGMGLVVIAVVGSLVGFGHNLLSNDIAEVRRGLSGLDVAVGRMDERVAGMGERMDRMNGRLAEVEDGLVEMEQWATGVDVRLSRIEGAVQNS